MNVDAQFPQSPIAALPNRPLQTQADQVAARPVDKADQDEPSNNRTGTDARETEAQKASRQPESESHGTRQESELSTEEKKQLEQLQARDREVRAHEAAHKAAAGSLARGGASFEFENGPDGRRYAVGGEVSIDTAKVSGDPQATLRKAQTIRAAANAPAQPSAQDRAVAAQATQMEAEARQELPKSNGPTAAAQTTNPAGHPQAPFKPIAARPNRSVSCSMSLPSYDHENRQRTLTSHARHSTRPCQRPRSRRRNCQCRPVQRQQPCQPGRAHARPQTG